MSNVLVLKSSISGNNSQTNQLVDYAVEKLQGNNIIVRDLSQQPLPYFDTAATIAVRGEPKNDEEKQLLALSDELVSELKNAKTLVIGAPMYNLGIPTQLKTYFDFIARPRVTFQYTAGPEELLKGKKAIVLCAFGGLYDEENLVTQYMKSILGFIGITDVQFVYAQGIGFGPEAIEKAQASAKNKINEIVAAL
ncbi:FMN-dependent NADH-azoreductase [Haemophilus quentini]|uniref:FMN dependent NADH:quinone oxidoreductase n=1 Tax=Haemophilus quentini TaxID=123834 RepID=A0ABX3BNR0_9PAST|nr:MULTISPECIES: FMN-dependent NADH-azoreductase [Haemophilus]EGT81574.1 FMN-dependent NADH-azoreductase [Haemophilus haemolyticus M21639]NYA48327.1 FMN-dependent NADH-azoreductase [Haemophilus haemolyticus]OEY74951.1 FMN-dependent NADH-azoreductase [Haemophilus quentini]OEY75984.1 FMN-dependent NADH-azoreductase [Haemophilus quentini]ORC37128.1 FMN-dependent NADH-azoreductase [Haemophilus quentini]